MTTLEISGPLIIRELTFTNTLLGRQFNNVTVASAADSLVAGTGWTVQTSGFGSQTVTLRYDGTSVWKALVKLAEVVSGHLRIRDFSSRILELAPFGASSNLLVTSTEMLNPQTVFENDDVAIIESIGVEEDSESLVNSVIAIGSGEGVNAFTLRWSNRTSPYTILSAIGPDGTRYYYIEDAASVATYGRRQVVLADKEIVPIANSPTGFQLASNALYDEAKTYIQRHKDPYISYSIKATVFDPTRIKVGNTVRVVHQGVAYYEGTNVNIGETRVGATLAAFGDPSVGLKVVVTETTDISSIFANVSWDGTGSANIKAAIYTDASGPDTKIAVTPVTTFGTAFAWKEFPFSAPVTLTPGTYWLCLFAQEAGIRMMYDTTVAGSSFFASLGYLEPTTLTGETLENKRLPIYAKTQGGRTTYLDIDDDLIVLERKFTFNQSGSIAVDMVVASVDRWKEDDTELVIGAIEDLAGFKTSVKSYTFETFHGTVRESVQAAGSNWFTYKVRYNNAVAMLHACWLDFDLEGLKSNTSGAASNTQQTSSGGSSHSHSVSGGTSSGGSSHSHSIGTLVTAGPAGAVTEQNYYGATSRPSPDPYFTSGGGSFDGHQHDYNHYHYLGEHSHFLATNTTNSEGSHSHSFGGSTSGAETGHTHSISAHSHAITYGIFRDSLPSPATTYIYINGIDRTASLGGPWTGDMAGVDITQYMVDSLGHPLRQSNTVQFRTTASKAYDIVAQAYSLVTSSAIGAV